MTNRTGRGSGSPKNTIPYDGSYGSGSGCGSGTVLTVIVLNKLGMILNAPSVGI